MPRFVREDFAAKRLCIFCLNCQCPRCGPAGCGICLGVVYNMGKKVCMFVLNPFVHDARVMRACTALAEGGYQVDLIAVSDDGNPSLPRRENAHGFSVYRVEKKPWLIKKTVLLLKWLRANPLLLFPTALAAAACLYLAPLPALLVGLYVLSVAWGATRKLYVYASVLLKMTCAGLRGTYDIYHANDLNTLVQALVCGKVFHRKKVLYDSHEVQASRVGYGGGARLLEKLLVRRPDRILMTTDTRADFMAALYGIPRPDVIHNYAAYTGDESILHKQDLHRILLYQGGLGVGRGLENIIEAAPHFNRGVVVFIGKGKLRGPLEKRAAALGITDRVRFRDMLPLDTLKYYTADAYLGFQLITNICFNHYSALSNKLFEYMMSDVPVVACGLVEIKKVVQQYGVGVCVDSREPMEIARGVNALLDDPRQYAACKQNCRVAKQQLNWDVEKVRFLQIYSELLDE